MLYGDDEESKMITALPNFDDSDRRSNKLDSYDLIVDYQPDKDMIFRITFPNWQNSIDGNYIEFHI